MATKSTLLEVNRIRLERERAISVDDGEPKIEKLGTEIIIEIQPRLEFPNGNRDDRDYAYQLAKNVISRLGFPNVWGEWVKHGKSSKGMREGKIGWFYQEHRRDHHGNSPNWIVNIPEGGEKEILKTIEKIIYEWEKKWGYRDN